MKTYQTVAAIMLCFLLFFATTSFNVSAQQKTVKQLPGGISLVWESDTYTPPFYKGKALHSIGSDMRIVAILDERFNSPDNFIYDWSLDGKVLGTHSGRGVRTFSLEGSDLTPNPLVTVSIRESVDGEVLAAAGMRPHLTEPFISLHEINPVTGSQFQTTLTNELTMQEDEVTLSAYPYFFSAEQRDTLDYTWRVNGAVVGNAPTLTFRGNEESGISEVFVRVAHPNKLFQQTSKPFIISF